MTVRVRVKLPKIGMTMEEATIVRFCRQPGEAFRKGDPLYEIETEKISQEVEATGDGVMVEHAVPEGSDVRVGELVCVEPVRAGNTRRLTSGRLRSAHGGTGDGPGAHAGHDLPLSRGCEQRPR